MTLLRFCLGRGLSPLIFSLILGLSLMVPAAAQDLQLAITADRSPVAPGSRVGYTVTVSNTGGSTISGTTVDVQLPGTLSGFRENVTSAPSNVTCNTGFSSTTCEAGETLIWSVGDLDAGTAQTLLFGDDLDSGASDGPFTLSGTASATGQTSVNADVDVVIDTAPVISLGVGSETGPVAAGASVTYRLDYGVIDGQGGAISATLDLELPSGTTFQSASGGGTESGGVVTWSLGPINEGAGGEHTVTVSVGNALEDGTLLLARAHFDSGVSGATIAQADYVVAVHPPSAIRVVLAADDIPAVPASQSDDRTYFSLTVSNTSGLSATGTTVQLVLPSFITGFREGTTSAPSSVACNRFFSSTTCEPGEIMIWTPGELSAGESRTLYFEDDLRSDAVGGELLRLRGVATASRGVQRVLAENYRIDASPTAKLGLVGDEGPVMPGANYTYQLDYGALVGEGGLSNATLRLTLPAGVAFSSASDGGSESGGVVTWSLGAINEGDGDEQTATVTIDGGLPDGALLLARATLDPGTGGAPIMRSEYAVPVYSTPNPLQVALSMHDVPAVPEARVYFALTVSNTSSQSLTGTMVRLVLPEFISGFGEGTTSDPSTVACNTFFSSTSCEAAEVLVWTPGELDAGESRTLLFEDHLATTSGGAVGGELLRLRGVATTSRGTQRTLGATAGIDPSPLVTLGLSGAPGPVSAGENYVYRLDYGALAGAGGTPSATLQLELPVGTTLLSTTGAGNETNGVVTWALGPLNERVGGERTATVQLDGGLSNGTVLQAEATLVTGDSDERTMRATYPLVVGSPILSLEVTTSRSSVDPDVNAAYDVEVAVQNEGSLSLSDVTVRFVLPEYINNFGEGTTSDAANVACNTFFSSSSCEANEVLIWTPGSLSAGEERTLTFSPSATSDYGDLLRHRFMATAAGTQQVVGARDLPIADGFTIPVELAGFTGTAVGESVTLRWSTASEENNAGFDVERSVNGTAFVRIGGVEGHGTTTEAQSYRFADADVPFADTLFYRLRQMDLDGSFEYSPVVTVHRLPTTVTLLPNAPNPVRTTTRLRYMLPHRAAVSLQVYDLLGRRVATLVEAEQPAGRHAVMLDGTRLTAGTYFARLQSGAQTHTQRITVVR
jgi:uncharacterized repeat protein (TIGR01451 family)